MTARKKNQRSRKVSPPVWVAGLRLAEKDGAQGGSHATELPYISGRTAEVVAEKP